MQLANSSKVNPIFIESEVSDNVDAALPLDEQVTQFQEKSAIQKRLIAEQTMQIYWLIAELRDRNSDLVAS